MFTNEDESWLDIIIIATKLKMAALKLTGNLKALVQISYLLYAGYATKRLLSFERLFIGSF
jgi:hypothetical protein